LSTNNTNNTNAIPPFSVILDAAAQRRRSGTYFAQVVKEIPDESASRLSGMTCNWRGPAFVWFVRFVVK
jgi:hypothetical protein